MKTLFVSVDFSKSSSAALRLAMSLAAESGNKLIVFHCYSIPTMVLAQLNNEDALNKLVAETEEARLQFLLRYVHKYYKRAGKDIIPPNVTCMVSFNNMPAETIVEMASHHRAALLIMGTHGLTGLKKILFGSTTATTIRDAGMPVLAVPENYRRKRISNICLASDLVNIEKELKLVNSIGHFTKAPVSILHMQYVQAKSEPFIGHCKEILRKRQNEAVKLVVKKADISKKLIEQIQKEATGKKFDCLAMCPHEKGFWSKILLGSKTEDISASIKIPLLSFKMS